MRCIQTKHLQDNYQYWIGQLKEMKNAPEREHAAVGETGGSLSGAQVALEEIAETEVESEHGNELHP